MPKSPPVLGKRISVHATAPIHFQRAVFVAALSLIFFLAVMFAFYLLQSFIYFLLASAFLVIYLVTMLGIFTQRRNVLNIFEHGFSYKKFVARWEDIESVDSPKPHIHEIRKTGGETVVLSSSLTNVDNAAERIRSLANAHR
jgi:hypothetical protein